MTKRRMATLLRRDAKKRGDTLKQCPCCGNYGYVTRNSGKDVRPAVVKTLEEWYYQKLLFDKENGVTESN